MVTQLQLMVHGARSLVKTAVDRPSSKDLGLDMGSTGGAIADYTPTGWGSARTGRAAHLGDAMGRDDIGFSMRHPLTHDTLSALGGMGAGGVLGGGLGYLGSKATGGDTGQTTARGALVGAGVGGLHTLISGLMNRRAKMKDIAKEYDEGGAVDKTLRPAGVHGGVGGALLNIATPFGGAHRAGQADIYEALNNRGAGAEGDKVRNGFARNTANVLGIHPVYRAIGGAAQGINAASRIKDIDAGHKAKKRKKVEEPEQTKAARHRKRADNEMLNKILAGGKDLLGKVDLKNPLHTGAIGAGIGGLGGLASSALSDEDPEKKSKLKAMLMGGLAGGGIGAGAGAMYGGKLPSFLTGGEPGPTTPVPPVPTPEQMAAAAGPGPVTAVPPRSSAPPLIPTKSRVTPMSSGPDSYMPEPSGPANVPPPLTNSLT